MHWPSFYRLLLRLGFQLAGAGLLYWLWVATGWNQSTAGEAEGIGILILLIGSIYAVVFAFVIYVIWGQFTDVEAHMMRECKSLGELLRFADFVNRDAGRMIRHKVADYVQRVVKSEWPALGDRRRDRYAEQGFSDLFDAVVRVPHETNEEYAAHQRLLDILREVSGHRDERLTKSLTQIPATLIHLVHLMEIGLLILVFIYPFHFPAVGVTCFLLIAVILFLANLVMTDTDNPFKGAYNISPRPFIDLKA